MKNKLYLLAALAVLSIGFDASAQVFHRPKPQKETNRYEIPKTVADVQEQIIEHTGFTVSYNSNMRIPNWVCWELTPEEAAAENVSRTDEVFQQDPDVRGAQAEDSDYKYSGLDRGHMCPAADMKWSQKAMTESFYFSNICPQNRKLNSGKWLELEQKCRYWAKKYKTSVYIAAGPLFVNDKVGYIGKNEVVIPDAFFKAVAQERNGKWVGAMFVIPNTEATAPLVTYAYPFGNGVDVSLTGFKFFANVPQDIYLSISAMVNNEDWEIKNWK